MATDSLNLLCLALKYPPDAPLQYDLAIVQRHRNRVLKQVHVESTLIHQAPDPLPRGSEMVWCASFCLSLV